MDRFLSIGKKWKTFKNNLFKSEHCSGNWKKLSALLLSSDMLGTRPIRRVEQANQTFSISWDKSLFPYICTQLWAFTFWCFWKKLQTFCPFPSYKIPTQLWYYKTQLWHPSSLFRKMAQKPLHKFCVTGSRPEGISLSGKGSENHCPCFRHIVRHLVFKAV